MRKRGDPGVPVTEHEVIGYHASGLGKVLILLFPDQGVGNAHDHDHVLCIGRETETLNVTVGKRELTTVRAVGVHAEYLLYAFVG